jgi:hypothetical protein
MSRKHPQNGPSLSKPTIKHSRPTPPSPARQKAELEEAAREAHNSRTVHRQIKTDLPAFIQRVIAQRKLREE